MPPLALALLPPLLLVLVPGACPALAPAGRGRIPPALPEPALPGPGLVRSRRGAAGAANRSAGGGEGAGEGAPLALPFNGSAVPRRNGSGGARRARLRNPFYPLSPESYGAYAVMCLSVVIFGTGILGNMAVMCIVCHNYYMRSISNSLLANLAFWDFLVLFFCLPLVIFQELTKKWLLEDFSCKVVPYIEVTAPLAPPAPWCSLGRAARWGLSAASLLAPRSRELVPLGPATSF